MIDKVHDALQHNGLTGCEADIYVGNMPREKGLEAASCEQKMGRGHLAVLAG